MPKQTVLLLGSIRWLRKNKVPPKGWKFMGKRVVNLLDERINILIKERKCQFPGCSREVDHFVLNDSGGLEAMSCSDGYPMRMTIDHKIARSLGGSDGKSNKWVMCLEHNQYKARLEHAILVIINKDKSGVVNKLQIPLEKGEYEQFEFDSTGYP